MPAVDIHLYPPQNGCMDLLDKVIDFFRRLPALPDIVNEGGLSTAPCLGCPLIRFLRFHGGPERRKKLIDKSINV